MVVYLLHLNRKFKHAQHYLGTTSNLNERIARHRAGRGSAMLRAAANAGIGFKLARKWPHSSFLTEQKLKAIPRKKLCPLCAGRKALLKGRR